MRLWHVLEDHDELEAMGFMLNLGAGRVASLSKVSPEVSEDNEWAGLLVRLILALIGHRLRGQLWLEFGWPGGLCGLASDDAGARQNVLNRLREHYEGWQMVKDLPGAFWRKLQSRSVFQWMPVVQAVSIAEASGWVDNPALREIWFRRSFCIGQTAIDEVAIGKLRHTEAMAQKSKRVCARKKFSKLIESGVLHQDFNFVEPPFHEYGTPGMHALEPSFTKPSLAQCSLDTSTLSSTQKSVSWFTNTPLSAQTSLAHLAMLSEVKKTGDTEAPKLSWLCVLLRCQPMVVAHTSKHKLSGRGNTYQWYLPLGDDVGGVAALGFGHATS